MDKLKHVLPFRINISATFTAEPVATVLAFWGGQLAADFEVSFAPYNQVAQTLLDPAGLFAANSHGINIVLVRSADLDGDARGVENAAQLAGACEVAAKRDSCPLILCLCPSETPVPEVEQILRAARGPRFLDYRCIDELYACARKLDAEAERHAGIPYTEEYFASLGTALVRQIAALSLLPFKVIAVDCDNTLWDGICGEDGPAAVRVDEPRRLLQEFLLRQRDSGMLLCMVSKNNAADVMETFALHPEMPLRPEHFTASRVNWEPKPDSLASIAAELQLGLDGFIFIDDSPKECAEVDEAEPEVLTLALPEDVSEIPHFLRHVWAFDHPVVTEEDRTRAASYAEAQEFGRAFHSAHSLAEFMASLDLRVWIRPLEPDKLARVTQLTQRTNQFNFSTIRRSEAQVQALLASGYECSIADVSDRFGDYGLVGAMIFRSAGEGLDVDSFLLSCRALGRGVEHRMLAHLGQLAVERGLRFVKVTLQATSKNQPALDFLQSVGGEFAEPSDPGTLFRFPAAYLSELEWKPATAPVKKASASGAEPPLHRFVPFARIARSLSRPNQILAAIRGARPPAAFDASLSATERQLAEIWADLLKVPRVRSGDRFFDLGGHSLLAVLLISRVRDGFGVELQIDDVYSATLTLGELAAKIDAMRTGGMASDEYEALVAEIESLSDEEVRALLDSQ